MISTKAGERIALFEDLTVFSCEIVNPQCRLSRDGVYIHGSAEFHAVIVTVNGVEVDVTDMVDPDAVADAIARDAEEQYPEHDGIVIWDQWESEE